MSKRYAVDIVLLPPDNIMDLAIKVNHDNPSTYPLNKKSRLPHITLLQAIIKASDLKLAEDLLSNVAQRFKPLELSASLGHASLPGFSSTPSKSSYFNIEPSDSLQNLHEMIMHDFEDIATYDAKAEDFYDSEVRQASLDWVKNFVRDAAHENYWPHVTLMTGTDELITIPPFTARRLAICHMGDYNTCRKILFETTLT